MSNNLRHPVLNFTCEFVRHDWFPSGGKEEGEEEKQGQEETVASTEGQTQRPRASLRYGGLYIPLRDPHTPPRPHDHIQPWALLSFLGYALENRADEGEYDAEGRD